MEVIFFFQEYFFSVIQAKVVQFFTYWNQNFFFGKKIFRNFEIFFLNLRVPGYMEIQKKNSKFRKIFFPKKKFWFQYVKNWTTFAWMTENFFSWKKKFTSIKNDVFFFDQRGGTVEELFAYIFGIYIKFGYKDPSILAPSNSVTVAT